MTLQSLSQSIVSCCHHSRKWKLSLSVRCPWAALMRAFLSLGRRQRCFAVLLLPWVWWACQLSHFLEDHRGCYPLEDYSLVLPCLSCSAGAVQAPFAPSDWMTARSLEDFTMKHHHGFVWIVGCFMLKVFCRLKKHAFCLQVSGDHLQLQAHGDEPFLIPNQTSSPWDLFRWTLKWDLKRDLHM